MAAKIGILGESTVTTVATTTVYTVPADKSARIRILFVAEAPANTFNYAIQVGTPGSEKTISRLMLSDIDLFSGIASGSTLASKDISVLEASMGRTLIANGGADGAAIAPWPHDFYLSTGDTVIVGTQVATMADHLFQVIGVEDDA